MSHDNIAKRNQELEKHIENIKIRYRQHHQQKQKYFDREREYFNRERQRQEKLYKRPAYEEELESQPELDENEDLLEEIEENVEKPKLEKSNNKKGKKLI